MLSGKSSVSYEGRTLGQMIYLFLLFEKILARLMTSSLDLSEELKREAYKNDPQLEELVQQFAVKMAQQTQSQDTNTIQPLAGFVIKTRTTQAKDDYPKDLKVFINICQSPEIPAPPLVSKEEIQKALMAEDNTTYKVPMSLTPPRSDVDKGD